MTVKLNYMNGENPHMLFAVPYRALASQKYDEIKEIARKLGFNLNIQVSTGELRAGDSDIIHGKADISVIIYEKVFMFSSMDNEFLNYYNLLVLDEIGLTQDITRGIKADFILARAKMYSDMSVVALGTPYYDWSLYKEKYNFISICETKRPIELKTFPVYVNKNKPRGINHIDEECKALSCGALRVPVNMDGDINPTQWWDEVVINICKYHLNLNHRILIYINNREEVHKLSKRLYYEFKDGKILQPWKDKDGCRSYIYQKLKMEEEEAEDDLYGILDEDDYGAFAYGIGYHNASVPNEVRNLIEEEILKKEGHLRIVCCTETLAYGINSNVDVVIIPDMKKQRPDENTPPTFLRANEYMNYAGRAGRLQKGSTIDEQQNHIGYVYPFIRAHYKAPGSGEEPDEQQSDWEKLQEEINNPRKISSRYYESGDDGRPFYLLSIFPNETGREKILTLRQIKEVLNNIPAAESYCRNEERDVIKPLQYLLEKRLITRMSELGSDYIDEEWDEEWDEDDKSYALTESGTALTGFIISGNDFESLLLSVRRCFDKENFWLADLIFDILNGEEMTMELLNSVGGLYKAKAESISEMLFHAATCLSSEKKFISERFRKKIKDIIGVDIFDRIDKRDIKFSVSDTTGCNLLRVTAAILFWKSEYCNVKKMYNRYSISFPHIQRIAEKVSYHLDIMRLSIPIVRTEDGKTLTEIYGRERVIEVQEKIAEYSKAIYFHISPSICRILNYDVTNPVNAAEIRKIMRIYTCLNDLVKKIRSGKRLTNKQKRLFELNKKKIEELPPECRGIFNDILEVQ